MCDNIRAAMASGHSKSEATAASRMVPTRKNCKHRCLLQPCPATKNRKVRGSSRRPAAIELIQTFSSIILQSVDQMLQSTFRISHNSNRCFTTVCFLNFFSVSGSGHAKGNDPLGEIQRSQPKADAYGFQREFVPLAAPPDDSGRDSTYCTGTAQRY